MQRNSQRTHQAIGIRFEEEAGSGTKARFLPSAKRGGLGWTQTMGTQEENLVYGMVKGSVWTLGV